MPRTDHLLWFVGGIVVGTFVVPWLLSMFMKKSG